jgi:hypothetical protein
MAEVGIGIVVPVEAEEGEGVEVDSRKTYRPFFAL